MCKRGRLGRAGRFFNEHVQRLETPVPPNELSSPGTYGMADPGREQGVCSQIGSSTSFSRDTTGEPGIHSFRFDNPQDGQFGPTFERQGVSTGEEQHRA